MSVPYGQFFGMPVWRQDAIGIERWQLVHGDCPRKGETAVLGESIGYMPLNQLIEAAEEHWAALHETGRLPRIPDGKYHFRREPPRFIRMPAFGSGWFLMGMSGDLPLGEEVEITRFSDLDTSRVLITEEVAERVVKHRANSYLGPGETRFVLVRFEPVVDE
jgi:hypothetical protein